MKQITMDYELYQLEIAQAGWNGEIKAAKELARILGLGQKDIEERNFRMPDYPHETIKKICEHFWPED